MSWSGRRVLVTGGAGFLGANLCHSLAQRGARVVALDGFLFGGGANVANLADASVELVRGDIRELDLRNACEGASVIFNLAAQTSHMGGQNDPLADIAVNAVGQVRLIQAAREAAPDAVVVHASTRQFYGRVEKLPVDESQPVAPPDANGVSKFAGEQVPGYWSTGCAAGRWCRCGSPTAMARGCASATRGRHFWASGSAACWRGGPSRCGAARSYAI